MALPNRNALQSNGLQISGGSLAALAVGFDFESELLTLDEPPHTGALHGRNMNVHVGATIRLLNETKSLLRVEELHSTCSQSSLLETHKASAGRTAICADRYRDLACSWRGALGAGRQAGKISTTECKDASIALQTPAEYA